MQLFTDKAELRQEMSKLINECDTMMFAAAWASYRHDIFTLILKHQSKIKKGVIGLNYYQTDPDVLDQFIGDRTIHFIMQEAGVFHPKVYLFIKGKSWKALIGSANLTKAAFQSNQECVLRISSKTSGKNCPVRTDIQDAIKKWWKHGKSMTVDSAAEYRAKWQKPQKSRRELEASSKKKLKTPFSELIWDEFFEMVKADEEHNVEGRCYILSSARKWFKQYRSLSKMPELYRKLLAGTTSKRHESIDFRWFGNMGRGTFQNLIRDNSQEISDALDCIPLQGIVTINHYRAYYKKFLTAFPDGKGHALGVMSRLISMKRPDYFLCWNGGNKQQFSDAIDIVKPGGHNYERYWTDVVENITASVWWQAPRPSQTIEREVWRGRAAMLDAIFYVPV